MSKASRVHAYRESHECGLEEAKRAIENEDRINALVHIREGEGSAGQRLNQLIALLIEDAQKEHSR